MNSIVSVDPGAIHIRAYTLWQERGCPQGSAEHDWFEAERDLERELQHTAAGSRAAAESAVTTPVAVAVAVAAPDAVQPASVKAGQKQARAARRATKRTQTTVVSKPGESALGPQNSAEKPAPAAVTGKRRAANGSM